MFPALKKIQKYQSTETAHLVPSRIAMEGFFHGQLWFSGPAGCKSQNGGLAGVFECPSLMKFVLLSVSSPVVRVHLCSTFFNE